MEYYIMKHVGTTVKTAKPVLIRVRNNITQDTFITSPQWPTKEIDGVTFLAIKMNEKDPYVKWMRKDNLVKVKV